MHKLSEGPRPVEAGRAAPDRVRPVHAALVEPRQRTTSTGSSWRTGGPTTCRSCSPPRSGWRRCWRQPAASPTCRRAHAADPFPRGLAVHGREGRGERGDGRRAAGIFSVILASRRDGVSARGSTTARWRRWRSSTGRSPRDQDERRHRRAGAVHHANAHHRARLRPALAEPPGGSVPGSPTWAAGNNYATTASRSPRTRSGAPGARHVPARGSVQPTYRQRLLGLPRHLHAPVSASSTWREHVRNMLRWMDPHIPPVFVLDRSPARAVHRSRRVHQEDALIDWIYENARCRRGVLALSARAELSIRAPRSARSRGRTKSRRRRTR